VSQWHFIRTVVWKTVLLFILANFLVIGCDFNALGRVTVYNKLVAGRERFPFGEDQQKAYNLSIYNLDAMFAAHKLSGAVKSPQEFRVFVMGDSSVWGSLLKPQETLTGQLNGLGMKSCTNQRVVFYNLGYPTLSLTKDIMILAEAMRYQPDLILWPFTLEAFGLSRQSESPLVAHNPERVRALIRDDHLPLKTDDGGLINPSVWEKTLIGRRRELADWLHLQLYAGMWAATGIDQDYPLSYPAAQRDFKQDDNQFHKNIPPQLPAAELGPGLLEAGYAVAGSTPVVLINEPILISQGKNSQMRYNFYYPRWAYDQYRQQVGETVRQHGWAYADLWNLIPENDFTNSAIHLTPQATGRLAETIANAIQGSMCK
jgi:hypothetical protein